MNELDNTKTTIIGNGFLIDVNKKYATKLADYMIEKEVSVYEVRFPVNKEQAQVYGRLNPDIDINSIVTMFVCLWN